MSLKSIIVIIVAFFLIRFISGIWKFRKAILQQRDAFMGQANQAQRNEKKAGDMNVINPKKSKPKNTDEGSYIDYEEIE